MAPRPSATVRLTSYGYDIPTDFIDTHDPAVGALGVAVHAVLVRYTDSQTGVCPLDTARIARVLDLIPTTVTTTLQRLAAAGLITIEEHGSDT